MLKNGGSNMMNIDDQELLSVHPSHYPYDMKQHLKYDSIAFHQRKGDCMTDEDWWHVNQQLEQAANDGTLLITFDSDSYSKYQLKQIAHEFVAGNFSVEHEHDGKDQYVYVYLR